jgi:4'-phosphopantetheinyl transferase
MSALTHDTSTESTSTPTRDTRRGPVHVWWTRLDDPALPYGDFIRILSDDERERAEAMPDDLRRRHICCHGLLRTILARYCGMDAEALVFTTDELGKPRLIDPPYPGLSFNLTQDREMGMIAVAEDEEVGVDVEHRSRWQEIACNATEVFTAAELELIDSLPERYQHPTIVRGWVRKEALLKAAGAGLTVRLSDIDVLSAHARSINLPGRDDAWRLVDLQLPDPDWIAALAITDDGESIDVQLRHWAEVHLP